MSVLAAVFRTAHEADEATSELRLRGFTDLYTRPCGDLEALHANRDQSEAEPKIFLANLNNAPANPGSILTWGREMISTGGAGWSLFESLKLDSRRREQWADGNCTLVLIDAGDNAAIVRTVLETNGADEIHTGIAAAASPEG